VLVGGIGLVRLPDFFTRLHAPTKATTLGVGGMLLASMTYFLSQGVPSLHELLIALFLFVTAPVSAHMLAKAGLQLRLRSRAPLPPREP
jgi:multicomponent K+:H+ antiporter subunit G